MLQQDRNNNISSNSYNDEDDDDNNNNSNMLSHTAGNVCVLISVYFISPHTELSLGWKPVGRGFDFRWCHWKLSLT